jgi:signal transduction histidine kinase
MRSVYLAIYLIIVVGLLLLSIMSLLRQGYKNSTSRIFAGFSVLVAIWILSNYIGNDVDVPQQFAIIANYLVFSACFGATILFMQLIIRLVDTPRLRMIARGTLVPLWLICIIGATPFVVAGIKPQGNVYAVEFGPLIGLYTAGLFFIFGVMLYGIIYGLRHSKGIRRRQLLSVSFGLAMSLPLILLMSFLIPLLTGKFSATEFGITPLVILVISLYYGVIKYSLFDIRLTIIRISTYALSLTTLAAIYYVAVYLASAALLGRNTGLSVGASPIDIAIALLMAFAFQPIKHFFDRITNRIFYRDNYNSDDFFAKLNRTLALTTDLRDLLERAANEIGQTLKSEQAFFFANTADGHYLSAGTLHHRQLPKTDAEQLEAAEDGSHKTIVASLLDEHDPIYRLMLSHRLEVVLPLVRLDQVVGFLCLGYHLTSGYTSRDLKVLATMSDSLAIAIQNALAVEEIRRLNATLQQRINNATTELRLSNARLRRLDKSKDEFVSLASHQLRTPLTGVKGYISMVLDGDAGDITDAQRQLLSEAFVGAERMVRLIGDFLNVSRLQTGNFTIERRPIDLSKLVAQELDSLQAGAMARGLKFNYHHTDNFPNVEVDEEKMRQVVMNFADNAIYYSPANNTIDVSLNVEGNTAVFKVIDNGIGVPKSEQPELFNKFFRATNARKHRPDGTGVGLYLAKKIITAHGGHVIFESTENKGSTFGFRLPIKHLPSY